MAEASTKRLGPVDSVSKMLAAGPEPSTTVLTMGNRLLQGLWLVVLLAGCQNSHTPFDGRRPQEADDPMLTTQEQRVRARSFYAYPDEVGNLPGQSTYREYYYR